jgi:hypothetical protein
MLILYLISDVILAVVFESVLRLVLRLGKGNQRFERLSAALKKSTLHAASRFGIRPSPLTLIWISFGVDPMTGRTAALAAGHGFVTGWLIAVTGDMFFFAVLLVSTLWLNSVLGDGTLTAVIIMVAMFAIPALTRRVRTHLRSTAVS